MSRSRKRFAVVILPPAERDLGAIYDWIAIDSPREAMRLFNSLVDAAESLATFPRRAPV